MFVNEKLIGSAVCKILSYRQKKADPKKLITLYNRIGRTVKMIKDKSENL